MGPLDLVVPVREGPVNEQLRYALRSWAAHLPHGRVWIIGYLPAWVAGVRHVPTEQAGRTKYVNTTSAVRAACEHPEVSDPILLCNDDFFTMRPIEEMPVLHRGPVREVEAYYASRGNGSYLRGLRETRDLLVQLGHADPLSYELHVPLEVGKAAMLAALDAGRHLDVIHKRTMYGNLAGLGGERIDDVKVLHRMPRFDKGAAFLSTMPDSFTNGAVGHHIRRAFPQACTYERRR
ncbi:MULTISPECIES: hypothetical protein [unclassified Streptomyces]|uniref:hypothetical protein n=1 Tax=unclassified Streptomyces TaxID=2593676 RepID=UPI00037E7703|nr:MULTISPECIES: hypothetical protein [unclassified Streptomyces]MYX39040.1 hypothetical protein [Streptomyces sp. SID8377]